MRCPIQRFAHLALCFLAAGSPGWASQDEVATLIGELRAPVAADRAQAAYELAELGGAAAASTAALAGALRDDDRYVRHAAAYALGEIGRGDAAVDEALRRAMRNRDRFLRVQAAFALARLTGGSEGLGLLSRLLEEREIEVRFQAAAALARLGPVAGVAIRPLTQALDDPAASVRTQAAVALGRIGEQARSAAPSLERAGARPGEEGRAARAALVAVGGGRGAGEPVAPPIEALEEPDEAEAVPPASPRAIAVLERELQSDDGLARVEAALALAELDESAAVAVAVLRTALTAERWNVRRRAARVIAQLGPIAAAATPELERAIRDPDPFLKRLAAEALLAIGDDAGRAALGVVTAALRSRDRSSREWAIAATAKSGVAFDADLRDALEAALDDPDPSTGSARRMRSPSWRRPPLPGPIAPPAEPHRRSSASLPQTRLELWRSGSDRLGPRQSMRKSGLPGASWRCLATAARWREPVSRTRPGPMRPEGQLVTPQ